MGWLDWMDRDHGDSDVGNAAQQGVDRTNTLVTEVGVADAALAAGGGGLGGSWLGPLGGALAAVGLAQDVGDISEQGLNADNGLSAAGNAMGLGSFGLGALANTPMMANWALGGASGGAALAGAGGLSATMGGIAAAGTGAVCAAGSAVLAAGAAGVGLGTASNQFMSDTGLLGENADGTGRSWSDWGADTAVDADQWVAEATGSETLGTIAGLGTCLGTSLVGTAGTLATAPLAIANAVFGSGVGETVGAVGGAIGSAVGGATSWVGSLVSGW